MEHKNKPAPAARIWALYLIVGVLFMAGVVFFSNWKALCSTEERFCQILDFVKSQSTRYEKYNDTVAAKTLRRTAVSVQALADDPALDFSDPQCLKKEAGRLWLTGISVLDLRARSSANIPRTGSAMPGLATSSGPMPLWTSSATRRRPI